METASLKRVYDLLGTPDGDDIHLYSVTIDSEQDTVALRASTCARPDLGPLPRPARRLPRRRLRQ